MLRSNILRKIKVRIKVLVRIMNDLICGTYFKFPKKGKNTPPFTYAVTITQEIKPAETFDNKIYNLTLASKKINQYIIMPNQIFSFWNIIGNPETQFKKGRSIVSGKMSEESGGGLCQVSGIIYYAGLLSGLEVLERHNHSIDIYTDKTRFTPLGTDATVVYGYKDLRLRNNLGFPFRLNLEVAGNTISINLQTPEKLHEKKLLFYTENTDGYNNVNVYDKHKTLLNQSKYMKKS